MERECPACDGSGVCQNEIHDRDPLRSAINSDLQCPGCGQEPDLTGKVFWLWRHPDRRNVAPAGSLKPDTQTTENHSSPRGTTKLYDRREEEVSLERSSASRFEHGYVFYRA